MIRIGHRGAMGYEPENTLRSFKKALALNVDMIEFDVYTCKTGEVVIIHDDKVDRTTNGKGYVMQKTLKELRSLDAGKGEKIPLLEEALDCINKKVQVNIELKGEGTSDPVYKIIQKYIKSGWSREHFLISSFNHPELKKFSILDPKIRIGALLTGIPLNYAEFAEKMKAYSINLSQEFINKAFVDDAHKRKLKVFVYTVND